MRKRKGFRRVLSLAAAGIMALSLISVGGAGSISEAAGSDLDAASAINYSTVLGRAVDFGLTAGQITQEQHMETTIATNLFKNGLDGNGGSNNDIDLAGGDPVHLIIGGVYKNGDVESKVVLGKAYEATPKMIYNIETTSEIKDNILANKHNSCLATIKFNETKEDAIKANINRIIEHTQDYSKILAGKTAIDLSTAGSYAAPHYYLDLSDEKYEGKTVYVDVAQGSDIATAIGSTGSFHIKKRSDTVVVMNVRATANNGDNSEFVLNKFFVSVRNNDGTFTEEISSGDQGCAGNDSPHNRDIDNEICQKVIWNVINATQVQINNCAGAYIVPTAGSKVYVGNSAGWLVTIGEIINNYGEWHYIYHGRSKDVNEDEGIGQMHFAARKTFTGSLSTVAEDTTISMKEGDYKFNLYKTGADYNTGASGVSIVGTAQNDGQSKIKFPTLSFETAGTHYYVIKEQNAGAVKNGIRNSDGEVDIQLDVSVDEKGIRSFTVSSKYYLSAADKATDKVFKKNEKVAMSGVEFSLGGFYNQLVKDVGSLSVTKTVTGAPASASGKEYSFTIKNSADKWIKADGSISDSIVTHTIKDGETKTFDGLSFDTYTVTEDKDGAKIEGCTLDSSSVKEGTAKIAVAGETKTVALKNIYKQDTGSLSITKKVEKKGDVTKTLPTSFQFAVKNSEGNYITDNNGTVGTSTPHYFSGIAADATLKIINLPVGKYTIEEADARVADLTLAVNGLEEVTVTKDAQKSVEVKNTYETPKKEVGELHIKKTITGDTVPAGKTFPVSISFDKAGSYAVNVNGTGVKMVAFEAGKAQVFEINSNGTIDITDILLDTTYNVKEVLSEEDKAAGYSMVSISDNSSKTIATTDQKETVTISNKYTKNKVGVLELVKTINGELTKEEREGKLKFTVTGPNNYNKTFKISETDEQGLKPQSDGTYKLTLTNMPVGNYSVTETTEKIDGKTVTVKYSIGNGSGLTKGSTASNVLITDGGTTVVNFENTYEEDAAAKGSLNIRKQFRGAEPSKDIKDKIAFTISKDGKVVKTVYYKDADNMGSIKINDLEPGTYTVTESGYKEEGKTVTIATTVSVPDESDISGTKDSVTVEVKSGKISGVGYTNTYKKDDTSEEGSSEGGSSEEGSSKEETSQESGGNTTSSEDKNGQNTTSSEVSTQQPTTTSEQLTTQQTGVSTKKTTESDDDEDDEDEDEGKGNLIITIYDEKTGGTVPGAKISVTNPEGKTKKYTTNNDGQVTIKKTAVGDYTVKVTEVPKGYTVSKNAEVDVEVKKNKTTKAQVRIDKNGEVSVTSKTTNSATKTGDALPIVPVMLAFATSILGLIALAFRKRWGV